jgi:hypothetical protein
MDGPREIALPSGRRIGWRAAGDATDEVTLRDERGGVLLEVTLTPEGPRLRFRAAAVEMECKGGFRVQCQDFEVHAAGRIVQEAGGDLAQIAGGDALIEARRGDARITANDDVKLNGERVRLNC